MVCTQQCLPSSVNFEFVNKVVIPELHYKVDSSKTVSDSTIAAAEPDHSVIYRLLESYVMAATIVDWLRIVGYEFAEGPTSALKSAESMATTKLTLLRSALTPAPVVPRPHKTKASPRRISPI